nr:hypothetical protein [Tanacetum cinerariifolium]
MYNNFYGGNLRQESKTAFRVICQGQDAQLYLDVFKKYFECCGGTLCRESTRTLKVPLMLVNAEWLTHHGLYLFYPSTWQEAVTLKCSRNTQTCTTRDVQDMANNARAFDDIGSSVSRRMNEKGCSSVASVGCSYTYADLVIYQGQDAQLYLDMFKKYFECCGGTLRRESTRTFKGTMLVAGSCHTNAGKRKLQRQLMLMILLDIILLFV